MLKENLVKQFEVSMKNNWDVPAFSDFNGKSLSYGEVAENIIWLHYIFEKAQIKKGDKIALIGKNFVNWAVAYLATITYGAVIVPILPDFHADDVHHIVNHSDSVLLFALESIYEKLDETKMQNLEAIFSLEDFKLLYYKKKGLVPIIEKSKDNFLDKYGGSLIAEKLSFPEISNNELAEIVYTSGTTGFSKGVMLSHNSLIANVIYAQNHMDLKPGDTIASFLPIAHTFGCAFEFLFPFSIGCHITFLGKIPSPKIILQAFKQVRPRLILSVPLVLEKIYDKQIKSALDKGIVKILINTPLLKNLIYKKVCNKLVEAFGGNFKEIVIGGAALNEKVETFLKRIGFPVTVGYGLTECGPLVSYVPWDKHKTSSVGKIVDTLEVRIDSDDQQKIVGEILVRGENVMLGYYKNEEATNEAIDKDGWLHTGDLGVVDEDGFIFIKGRCKSMILGPSGQNIYPEEIEAKLNNLPFIQESLLVQKNKKLVALIYPDLELADAKGINEKKLTVKMEENRKFINQQLPPYCPITKIELSPEEFEKTPTKKVKRYLYTLST